MKYRLYQCIAILFCATLSGCQKEYLAVKPNKALLVPTTLTDFQSLMDNLDIFNTAPSLQVIASDDFYATDASIDSYVNPYEKSSYIWAKDIDDVGGIGDWNTPYQQVFYTNVVLDGLNNMTAITSQTEFNRIKGSALFYRAFAFYNLAQMYARPYNASTASQDLGVPIRLESDVNKKSVRGTLQATYDQILKDLTEAAALLPAQSAFQSRPNSIAAKALLSRVYLNMENYDKALTFATEVLTLKSDLIDYNTLDKTNTSPFPVAPANNNIETIFYSRLNVYTFGISSYATVDNNLYNSYDQNDLRKTIFFTGTNTPYYLKGRYTGYIATLFGGLATDEMYLIKAECEARASQTSAAMGDLNTLLKTRWNKTVLYPVITATSADDALKIVLTERRKELIFRGLRWGDLRRLNKDDRFKITLTRTYNNQTYTLAPNSNLYTFPIPNQEILTSGIEQNLR